MTGTHQNDCFLVNNSCRNFIMFDRKVVKIQVKSCHNALLWYNKHVGDKFDVVFFDPDESVFWVRERDEFMARNWIACKDAEVLQ